jgi:hypothetical protein
MQERGRPQGTRGLDVSYGAPREAPKVKVRGWAPSQATAVADEGQGAASHAKQRGGSSGRRGRRRQKMGAGWSTLVVGFGEMRPPGGARRKP